MKSPQATNWKSACNLEYQALIRNTTWRLIQSHPDMTVIKCKWVFDVKLKYSTNPNETPMIDRFRARLVARGDSKVQGINFDEVYAPVVRFTSLWIILHIAAIHDLEIDHRDFCNAFLNGTLSEVKIHMEQPEGYISDTEKDKVYLLLGSLYGLRQSARIWYQCLHRMLNVFGMT